MDVKSDFYTETLERFHQLTRNPTHFLEANENRLCDIKDHLKKTYDYMKNEEIKSIKSNSLPALVVQNFDLEQIWQQLELQNESLLTRSLTLITKLIVAKNRLLFKSLENENNSETSEERNDTVLETANDESSSNEESISDTDVSDKQSKTDESTKTAKRSIVDDEFFKLHEMEQFLHAEEKKNDEPDSGNDSDESGSESNVSVDLFKADSDDDEDLVKTAKYKDFFVSKEHLQKKEPRNKFLEEMEEDDEEQPQSSFELRQGRLNKKIEEIEQESVREKPWQLKGEITSEDRPQNSLLEEIVEFDLTTRPAPVITEQTTMQLEDIIRQRIKDKVFDSVERKSRPVDTPLEYKKKLVLEQEKSKESLAQIYEKEYLEQQAALDPQNTENDVKEPELHQEIISMMRGLFMKLEALSNFHFTPKPATVELKIVSNLPAISMEEVTPAAVSEAALLAPEEVKNKMDIVGKNERTAADKKRERKRKKLKQKIHAAEKLKKEKMLNQTPGLRNKFSKGKIKSAVGKITKEKNVDKMVESTADKSVKSSKAFFTQLEEQVKTQIKRKTTESKSKKRADILNAKKLKL